MDVFVESNFLLELAFRQQEHDYCQRIWQGAAASAFALHLPQYCLAEVFETLRRRRTERKDYQDYLLKEVAQHRREAESDGDVMDSLTSVLTSLLLERTQTQSHRLFEVSAGLAELAAVIPLTGFVIREAQQQAQLHELPAQDSLVYASVLSGLRLLPPDSPKLFISRNEADFKKPDVLAGLRALNCDYLVSFQAGAGRLRV